MIKTYVKYVADFKIIYLDEKEFNEVYILKNVTLDSIRFIVPTQGIWIEEEGIWIPPHRILKIERIVK